MSFFEKFGHDFMTYPHAKWRQWGFKFPLVLWRMGLGPLMGHVFSLITVTGRKSGKPRHFLSEYYRDEDKLYIVAAYGEQAQWYKNLKANPYATVQTWRAPQRMKATRVTDDEELVAVFKGLYRRDPVLVRWYLDALGIAQDSPEDLVVHKDQIYLIRFDPTDAPTPLPLSVDLAWIWLVLLALSDRRRRRLRRRLRRQARQK